MWTAAVLGLLLAGYGGAAYAGRLRSHVLTDWPRPETSFGMLYAGLACILVWPMILLLNSAHALAVAAGFGLALVALAGFWIFLLSLFWLPARLLPRWYRRHRSLDLPQ